MDTRLITLMIDPDNDKKLEELAKAYDRSRSAQIRVLISEAWARFKTQENATLTTNLKADPNAVAVQNDKV